MKKYEVYAVLTGKIYLGEFEGTSSIEAARNAMNERGKLIKSNVEVEGLFDITLTPYDSVEVEK